MVWVKIQVTWVAQVHKDSKGHCHCHSKAHVQLTTPWYSDNCAQGMFHKERKGREKSPDVKWSSSPGIRVGGDTHCKAHHGLMFTAGQGQSTFPAASKHTGKYDPTLLHLWSSWVSVTGYCRHVCFAHLCATIFQGHGHVRIVKINIPLKELLTLYPSVIMNILS